MSAGRLADGIGLVLLLGGALLCLAASVGLLRLPNLLARMHAATKPQVLGVLLVLAGLGLRLRSPTATGMLVLVGLFQLLTIPVAGHVMARAAYRSGQVRVRRGDDAEVPAAADAEVPAADAPAVQGEVRAPGDDPVPG